MRFLLSIFSLLLCIHVAVAQPANAPLMPRSGSTPGVASGGRTVEIAPGASAQNEDEASDDSAAAGGWAQKLRQGGATIWFQVLLSIFGGAFALERAFGLRRETIAPAGLAEEADKLWQKQKFGELKALCQKYPSTLSRLVLFIERHRNATLADVSTMAGDIASREIGQQMQRIYPLAVVATLEPLLGLLGTVLGMIESFDVVVQTGTMGDPALLAAGISKALITTAVGLIIAIPFLGLYHFFKHRTNQLASLLEEEATELIGRWFLPCETEGDHARSTR